MTQSERAVIEAARNLFGARTIEIDTGETWRHNSICTWMAAALFEAVVALDGSRPFIDTREIRPRTDGPTP